MSKKEAYIQIRINTKEKEEWDKFAKENRFPSVSQLIRFAVNEIIERGLKRTIENNNKMNKTEELKQVRELITSFQEERKEYMKEIKELKKEITNSKTIVNKQKLKGQILKLLKFRSYTSEELSIVLEKDEPEIIKICNDLEDKKIIKMKANYEYEVI
ncbi:MAG: hypothetical protein ACFE8A_14670 [Candidatus Hodarchaeota archaeon]